MKIVRVHNPSGLRATKIRKGKKTVARRKRKKNTTARRATRARSNPRRYRRRRHNPSIVARSRRTINPRRRRHHFRRRRNPSASSIGNIFKEMIYGAGGAMLTRVGASVLGPLVPGGFAASPFAGPVVQVLIAVIPVRMIGKKFLGGQKQADLMMAGGLISAGLSLIDTFLPNLQGQLTSLVSAPIRLAPGLIPGTTVAAPAGATLSGFRDVYQVEDSVFNGLGDVEDVPVGTFGNFF